MLSYIMSLKFWSSVSVNDLPVIMRICFRNVLFPLSPVPKSKIFCVGRRETFLFFLSRCPFFSVPSDAHVSSLLVDDVQQFKFRQKFGIVCVQNLVFGCLVQVLRVGGLLIVNLSQSRNFHWITHGFIRPWLGDLKECSKKYCLHGCFSLNISYVSKLHFFNFMKWFFVVLTCDC